jgi:hypothetical protein
MRRRMLRRQAFSREFLQWLPLAPANISSCENEPSLNSSMHLASTFFATKFMSASSQSASGLAVKRKPRRTGASFDELKGG